MNKLKVAAVTAMIAMSTPAAAGQITVTFTHSVAGDFTFAVPVTDANLLRIIAAYKNPPDLEQQAARASLTNQEVADRLGLEFVQALKSLVLATEKRQAEETIVIPDVN
jgi:hypothetical protein